jgi:putative ABC transport system permease protein
MLFNYIKIALRNILRNKLHSFINIIGLSIGMACAIFLFLFIRDELSYDKYHSKHERIYMVQANYKSGAVEKYGIFSSLVLGPALKDEYPVIEESVRTFSSDGLYFIEPKGEIIREDGICYADPGIFKVFDYKFIYGTPEGALDAPNTIVLSDSFAKKYFGAENPIGKTLTRNDGVIYTVKGVYEDLPRNSFDRFRALISMNNLKEIFGRDVQNSRNPQAFFNRVSNTHTYILLVENADIESIKRDYKRFKEKYYAEFGRENNRDMEPFFVPLDDVYLNDGASPGAISPVLVRIYILSALALFILIIACINYMNLATASSTGRAREVGVRKCLGASRTSLIRLFLSESIVISMASLVISFVLIELIFPVFNDIMDKELAFSVFKQPAVLTGLIIISLVVGLLSGSYPAFCLSSYNPVQVIKGEIKSKKGRGLLRKTLVIIQFSISITVIISTMLLYDQMDYIRHMDLGFNKEDILTIIPGGPKFPTGVSNENDRLKTFMGEIRGNSNILAVTRSSISTAGLGALVTNGKVEEPKGELIRKKVYYVLADFDYIDLMQMKILEGRSFSREMETDESSAVLVNETLVKEMGWGDAAIGRRMQLEIIGEVKHVKVIGILKDFHFQSLHNELVPQVVLLDTDASQMVMPVISIKIRPENLEKTIKFLEAKWREIIPMQPFAYDFLDDIIRIQYIREEQLIPNYA